MGSGKNARRCAKHGLQQPEKNRFYAKKKSLIYKEGDIKQQQQFIEKIADIAPENLVYIDEAGFQNHDGERTQGYAARGERVKGQISGKRSIRHNVIAGLCNQEIIAPLIYQHNMTVEHYESYMIDKLLPQLKSGQVVVQDNARFHKITDRIKRAYEEKGCTIIYLPPYSPQLNPIERLWNWIKSKLKRLCDRMSNLQEKLQEILEKRFFCLEGRMQSEVKAVTN